MLQRTAITRSVQPGPIARMGPRVSGPQAVSRPSCLLNIPLNHIFSQLIIAPPPSPPQLFGFKGKAPTKKAAARPTVIPTPSYNIPAVLLGGAGLAHFGLGNDAVAGVAGVLGAFLAVQATRVKFIFDDSSLEVLVGATQEKTENAFVGGENKWSYESFVNW